MPLRKRGEPENLPARRSLVASAVDVPLSESTGNWWGRRAREEAWQGEAWRLYDFIGELHFIAGYVGSACSRVRIYVADVDKYGRIGDEASDDKVQAIAETLFGAPAAKQEALRAMGIGITIAGECYIVGRSVRSKDSDEWNIMSASEIKRHGGATTVRINGDWERLNPRTDLVIRVWRPHPRRGELADSPTRSALPLLKEIEQLTKYVFSQIDSRLANGGLFPIPNNLDFPSDDGTAPGAQGLMDKLTQAMSASLSGNGTAAALVPIFFEVDPDTMDKIPKEPIRFESVLSEQAKTLRDEAIRRLALAMDVPPEVLTGTGSTNHWSAWHIEESAVKIHIEPIMSLICDALTKAYLGPALRSIGKNPDKFAFYFDTAPLTVRPNRLTDTLNLFERGIVSAAAVLEAGAYNPDTDAPDEEEENKRFVKELMLRDPTLFSIKEIRELVGIKVELESEQAPEVEGELAEPGAPPPPAPERAIDQGETGQRLPERPAATRPDNRGTSQNLIAAGTQLVPPPSAALVAADLIVRRALELAGGRLLTPAYRGQFPQVPRHELHTKIKVVGHEHANRLLERAWDTVDYVAEQLNVDPQALFAILDGYTRLLLTRSTPHNRQLLAAVLAERGLLDA